jgi:4-amino-4-deoxy-L-arabinose transferase-like glycosyltransferase
MLLASLALGGALRWSAAGKPAGLPAFWEGDGEYYGIGGDLADAGAYRMFPGWPRTAYRMPLYPTFLAAARRLAPGPRPARRLQALLDLATLCGVALIAALAAGPLGGGLAALLYALAPLPVAQVPVLMLESFFSFLVVAAALALMLWRRKPASAARGAAAGAALGLTLLCRSTLFAVPGLVLLALWRAAPRPRRLAPSAAAFLAACYLGLAPWIARNAVVFRAFVPFENGAAAFPAWGASLGLLPAITVPSMIDGGLEPDALARGQRAGETERGRFLFRLALQGVARRPLRYAAECLRRVPLLWQEQVVWLLLAALGLLAPRRLWRALAVPWLLIAYFNVYALMGVQPRYARPAFGLVCAAAAAGLIAALRRLARWPLLIGTARVERQARAGLAAALTLGGGLALAAAALLGRECLVPAPADPRDPGLERMNAAAVDLSVHGRWAQADALFGAVLKKDPAFAESLISRAFVRERRDDLPGALLDERRAAQILEFGAPRDDAPARLRLDQF